MLTKFSACLSLYLLLTQVETARILVVFPAKGPSHYILVQPLLRELAQRGHEITAITPYPQSKSLKNYRDFAVLQDFKGFSDKVNDKKGLREQSLWQLFDMFSDLSYNITQLVLQHSKVQALLHNPKETFDLVMYDICFIDALYGLAAHFGASLVGVAPFGAHTWNTDLSGAPTLPAFMPYPFLPHGESMTFAERLLNFYNYAVEYIYMHFLYLPKQAQIFEKYFAHTGRTLADVRANFSLVLLNQHSSMGIQRPYLPNMIEIGGMHVNNKINPLPTNMQQFLDNATEGAIYFSLGSNIRAETVPPEKLTAILNTFRSLPLRILWKFEIFNMANQPKNVLIRPWFPQSDVLAHPNVRLFITHGGLLSITESIVRGKPLLGIPFFGDQHMNMVRFEKMGFALRLDFAEFSEHESYARMARIISQRYHDKPQTALETGVFWVEYVLRHRGAPHLRCAGMRLNFFQYYGLDVMGLVLVLCLLLGTVVALGWNVLFKIVRETVKRKVKVQ